MNHFKLVEIFVESKHLINFIKICIFLIINAKNKHNLLFKADRDIIFLITLLYFLLDTDCI